MGVTQSLKWSMQANASFFTAPYSYTTPDNLANYAVWSGNSNLGRINGQGVSQSGIQYDSSGSPVFGTAPNGLQGVQLKLEGHYATTTLDSTLDAVFDRGFAGDFTAIADFSTGRFYEWGKSTIVGGTGAFEGATGTIDLTQEGIIQVNVNGKTQEPEGANGAFGYARGNFKYDIILPGKKNKFTSVPDARNSFVFDSITGLGPKTVINDFSSKDDRLVFLESAFNPQGKYTKITAEDGYTATDTIQFISKKNPAQDMRRQPAFLYDTKTGVLSYDADGSRSAFEPEHLATLTGSPFLSINDLVLL